LGWARTRQLFSRKTEHDASNGRHGIGFELSGPGPGHVCEALTLAQELSHPYILAVALAYAAMFYQLRREPHAVHVQAEAAITLCTEQGFAYYLAWEITGQGRVQVAQGQGEEGLALMRHGLAALRATGASLRRCLACLGRASLIAASWASQKT